MIQSGKDIKVFTGTMDQDTEARYMKDGNYRYLLNGRTAINSQGTFGAVEDVMGNVLVNNPALPAVGRNKVIGSYEDIAGQSCIFFVWNSLGYHGIYRWYANAPGFPNGNIELIYKVDSLNNYNLFNLNPLNFQQDKLITGTNMFSNIICWTDDFNQPKTLDTVKASKNKATILNIYLPIEPLSFGNTVYNINFNSITFPVINPFFVTVSVPPNTSLFSRCQTITNQINTVAGAFLTAVNKNNYIEITPSFTGDFYALVSQFNNNFPPPLITWPAIPKNSYPWYRSVGVPGYSQPDLVEWHTNLIKSPPRCPIKAKYSNSFNDLQKSIFADLQGATTAYNVGSALWSVIHLGSTNDSPPTYYDTQNTWTLAPSVVDINLDGALVPAGAFYTPAFNDVIECEIYIRIRVNTNAIDPWRFYMQFMDNITPNQIPLQPWPFYESQDYYGATSNNTIITIIWKFQSSVYQGRNYHIDTRINWPQFPGAANVTFEVIDGYIKINSIQQSYLVDNRIPYIFRAKYIYWNNENSVYSAYSLTPKPVTYKENSIELDFSDLYLSSYTYITMIKNVVLSYSNDDGTTWYDFKLLQPYQFYHNQKYYFIGNENIRTVPTTEAIAQYHAVPLKAKGQEFVDSRLFFGAILEGYDLINVDYKFTVSYVDLTSQAAYPTADIFNNAQTTLNFGSFWERGYEGYVGIVYYDDYDRKTFVNLSNNAKLTTAFWSQNNFDYYAAVIDWEITSDPPDWATKYHWVRTKNIRTDNYLEWTPVWSVVDDNYNNIPYTRSVKITITTSIGSTPYPKINYIQINGSNIMAPNYNVGTNDINTIATNVAILINGFGAYSAIAINNSIYIQLPLTGYYGCNMSASNGTPYLGYLVTNDYWGTYWALDFSTLATYNTKSGAKLSFNYAMDDIVCFKNAISSVASGFYETPIRNVVNNIVYINVNQHIQNTYLPGPVQVYSKSSGLENYYYEFGECYEIYSVPTGPNTLKKYHKGQFQDQTANQPATGRFGYGSGNAWYRRTVDVTYQSEVAFENIVVQRQTFIDFATQRSSNNGRINIISDKGQIDRFSSIRYSNKYISNTDQFGVNEFELLNENQYNNEYGKINKLQVVNNDILKLIFGNSYQLSIYVSQGVIRQTQNAGNLISLSDQVAGNSHIIQRTLGTINAESVIVNDEGDMFGYDENEGVVWVASGNGLIQISDRGMKSVFKQYSNSRKQLSSISASKTPAVYDLYHDEYIITLGNMPNPLAPSVFLFTGVTIAYNKQKGGWTSYYSFVPEYYGRVRDYIVSFLNGNLYIHDRNTLAKNFYGTQYTRQLTYLTNKDFPKVRDFKAISINGIGLNDLPTIRVLPFEGYPNGMLSLLTKRFFKTLEGVQYAYFQKDKLTPGMQSNQVNALANGRNLKGQVLEVTLVNNDTTKSSIYSSEIIYFYSEHS